MAFGGDVVHLTGIETVKYKTKDGKEGSFTRLHFLYMDGAVSGVEGCKVEQAFCPREVDPDKLELAGSYQQMYEVRDGKDGKTAILVGLRPVKEGG